MHRYGYREDSWSQGDVIRTILVRVTNGYPRGIFMFGRTCTPVERRAFRRDAHRCFVIFRLLSMSMHAANSYHQSEVCPSHRSQSVDGCCFSCVSKGQFKYEPLHSPFRACGYIFHDVPVLDSHHHIFVF